MLFMGEEWGSKTPFPFFCDFKGDLAEAVRKGRRREYGWAYAKYGDEVPDPLDDSTFRSAVLDWESRDEPAGTQTAGAGAGAAGGAPAGNRPAARGCGLRRRHAADNNLLTANWRLGDGASLELAANLSNREITGKPRETKGIPIWGGVPGDVISPWSVFWCIAAG